MLFLAMFAKLIESEDLAAVDTDGNNALHLASYCGHCDTVTAIVARKRDLVNVPNAAGETPVTLAIKKRGFHRTLGVLIDNGGAIPKGRSKGLQQYAIDKGFKITANYLSSVTEDSNVADETMTPEYLKFLFDRLRASKKLDAPSFLRVALHHGMVDLVRVLVREVGAVPTVANFMQTIPERPDAPETEQWLKMTEILHEHDATLIQQGDEQGQTLLFNSAERGSLPHVKWAIDHGAVVDAPNVLKNTPLWIACAKRYPCIIDELISRGADVNWLNGKGNPPMYTICQKESAV
jgi:ankyrin repeat protein